MPKFLFKANLTAEGVAGVRSQGGSARREAVTKSVKAAGGSVDAFYFAFGVDDVIGIVDFPDNQTAAGWALEVSSSGAVRVDTTVLLTPEEVDEAAKKDSGYQAPTA